MELQGVLSVPLEPFKYLREIFKDSAIRAFQYKMSSSMLHQSGVVMYS